MQSQNLTSNCFIHFQASNARKVYFLLFERGPRAFIHGTIRLVRECVVEGSGMQNLSRSASAHISERITVLTTLRYHLATFLAQVSLYFWCILYIMLSTIASLFSYSGLFFFFSFTFESDRDSSFPLAFLLVS